jgi:hypothetical protein
MVFVLESPRILGPRQERKLDHLAENRPGIRVVDWDDLRDGPVLRLPALPDGRYVVDKRGILRPVA